MTCLGQSSSYGRRSQSPHRSARTSPASFAIASSSSGVAQHLLWDVEQHFLTNGPWHYKLSHLYYTPEVTTAVDRIAQEQHLPQAA